MLRLHGKPWPPKPQLQVLKPRDLQQGYEGPIPCSVVACGSTLGQSPPPTVLDPEYEVIGP